MKNLTPLMVFYLVCCVAGAVVPWYYNLQFLQTGESFTFQKFFAAGMVSPLASSLTTDFIISFAALFVWMVIESRRLRIRYLWVYLVICFVVAWACAAPLFLFMRERRLRQAAR